MKLFNLMKGIFRKPTHASEAEDSVSYEGYAEEAPIESMEPQVEPQVMEYAAPQRPVAAPVAAKVDVDSSEMVLPLSSMVASFPVELQQRIRMDRVGETSVAFPLDKIMSQLPQGLVRVTFGEIRQAAPHAFTGGADRDFVMITLPLGELVSRLRPAMLSRRAARQVEVPDEVASPFAGGGQGLVLGKALDKRSPDTAMLSRPRGAQSSAPVPPAADPRARGNVTSVQKPSLPGGTSIVPKKPLPLPVRSVPPLAPKAVNPPLPPGKPALSKPPMGSNAVGGAFTKPIPANGIGGNGVHAPKAPATHSNSPDANPLWISLNVLTASLPESLQMEMAQLNLDDAKLALPADQVEAGLMRGRISFTWRQLRAWIRPAPLPTVSAHDGLLVNLPLAVIAPLFLARKSQAEARQKRVQVDEKIPNLFFGFPQPEAAPAEPEHLNIPVLPAPKSAETNYFVWDDEKDVARIEEDKPVPFKPAPSPGTTFASRKATPNDVVMKASLLEGVYGALVALPDGLLVASKLSPETNGETIAALIPQMYSKLSGCTKELRMGELNNLNFTVGNVPWKIFRVNGIFFAAFGCAGEPLPSGHLAELAAELDYKKAQ